MELFSSLSNVFREFMTYSKNKIHMSYLFYRHISTTVKDTLHQDHPTHYGYANKFVILKNENLYTKWSKIAKL